MSHVSSVYLLRSKDGVAESARLSQMRPGFDSGARFSKDPVTYRARNQILISKSQEKYGVF